MVAPLVWARGEIGYLRLSGVRSSPGVGRLVNVDEGLMGRGRGLPGDLVSLTSGRL